MARSLVLIPGLVLSLSACAQIPAPADTSALPAPVADVTASEHCDAGPASEAAGQLPTPETQERARARARAEVRVLRHNQPITKEFRMGRLNLVLDAEGRIASINCS